MNTFVKCFLELITTQGGLILFESDYFFKYN
jgi:hypothetical protein